MAALTTVVEMRPRTKTYGVVDKVMKNFIGIAK